MVQMGAKRIDAFLHEDEVPAWVSTLKHDVDAEATGSQFDPRLGAIDATFQWHANKHMASPSPAGNNIYLSSLPWYKRWFGKANKMTPQTQPRESPPSTLEHEPAFRLRDINILFPRSRLSVVTGPTGSGKSSRRSSYYHRSTALLNRL